MRHVYTEALIDASEERIWEILADVENWHEWNPLIPRAFGVLKEGETLDLSIQPPGMRPMHVKPRVTLYEPGKQFRWLGSLGIRGIFDGEHCFRLESVGENKTRLIHEEFFRGILIPLTFRFFSKSTEAGFHLMNEALRKRVVNSEQPAGC